MHYVIRYNHSHKKDPVNNRIWRVIENEIEHLVDDIKINVPSYAESSISPDDGLEKWNIACDGKAVFYKDKCVIEPGE